MLSAELDGALRRPGRPESLLPDELPEVPDELPVLSSEPEEDAVRRRLGRSVLPPDDAVEELPAEVPGELPEALSEGRPVRGREVSSTAAEAMECSSGVPSFTSVMVAAFQAFLLSWLPLMLT